MKIIFSLVALLMSSPYAFADLGAPNIQAIARVELVDGSVFEGMVSLGNGGYNYNYHPDAFCIENNNNYQLFPINLKFNKFSPNNYNYSENKKLYYAKNISGQAGPKRTSILENNMKDKILIKTIKKEDKYILTKEIILHTELPKNLHLAYVKKTNNQIHIDLGKIKKYSLIKKPSSKWLEYIKNSVQKVYRIMKEGEQKGEPWVDYMEPEWYHDIIKNKDKLNLLNQYY